MWNRVSQIFQSPLILAFSFLCRKEVGLSSNGFVIVRWDDKLDIHIFDKSLDSWISIVFKTPSADDLKSNLILAISKGVLTVAVT